MIPAGFAINTNGDGWLAGQSRRNDAFVFWAEHMRRGNFAAAWRISDEILKSNPPLGGSSS
ncbi:MAG: hypothetical protein ACREQ2_03420, partial [Candidatus Binatia bacterium]